MHPIHKLLKEFKEREGTHEIYKMPDASLYVDIHYTRGIYLSLTLYEEETKLFYTMNFNNDTFELISIDNELRVSNAKIVEVADIDPEKLELYNSKIINFINNYDPEYQINDSIGEIAHYEKMMNETIESYTRAINSVKDRITLYHKAFK